MTEEKLSLSAEEKAEQRINKYKHQIDEVITELKKRYPEGFDTNKSINRDE